MMSFLVAAFYKFTSLPDYEQIKPVLLQEMTPLEIKGTIILAPEGINGTICGRQENMEDFIRILREDPRFTDLHFKESYHHTNPFDKSKIKLRKEIVTMGVDNINPHEMTGIHVSPEEWNALIQDEQVLTIDTRNEYEVNLGTFKGAINPKTINFRDFPAYVDKHLLQNKQKKIAMFCTGGIRCEKSTAYLKSLGFDAVYQLDGGILNYLEKIPEDQSLWEGSCFVFDNRVAVDQQLEGLEEGTIDTEWKNKCRQKALEEAEQQESLS